MVKLEVRIVTMSNGTEVEVHQINYIDVTGRNEAEAKADEIVAVAPSWGGGNYVTISDTSGVRHGRAIGSTNWIVL